LEEDYREAAAHDFVVTGLGRDLFTIGFCRFSAHSMVYIAVLVFGQQDSSSLI
jgi:hypothetical protein